MQYRDRNSPLEQALSNLRILELKRNNTKRERLTLLGAALGCPTVNPDWINIAADMEVKPSYAVRRLDEFFCQPKHHVLCEDQECSGGCMDVASDCMDPQLESNGRW